MNTQLAQSQRLEKLTSLIYLLQTLVFVTGVSGIVALIIGYIKRDEVRGTYLQSHFTWQIRSFWYALILFFICNIFCSMVFLWVETDKFITFFILNILSYIFILIWYIRRIIKGWRLLDHRMPLPSSVSFF